MNPVTKMRVRDIMVTKPLTFTSDTDLLDAVCVLVKRRISGAPVVDERGNLIGLLTERDFLEAALVAGYHGERGGCVGDYMSRDVQAVNADDSLFDVATRFIESKRRRSAFRRGSRCTGCAHRARERPRGRACRPESTRCQGS